MNSPLLKYNQLLIAMLLALLSSCEADNYEDQDNKKEPQVLNNLSFAISRGLSFTDVNANDKEWIFDWHIVVVDHKGKIEVVMNRKKFKDDANNYLIEPSIGIEEEVVNTSNSDYNSYFDSNLSPTTPKVYEGVKHIYVFANMDIPVEFATEGNYINEETAKSITATVPGNGFDPSANHIPMSNVVIVTLDNTSNQRVDLPLVRMLAKVQFTFRSLATSDITVEKIVMNHVNTNTANNIYLLANLDDNSRPFVPGTSTYGSFDFETPSISVPVGNTTDPHIFYLNESAEPISETIGFTLTTKRDDRSSTEFRYALTQAYGLSRNTFLKIPVTLTDYEFNPQIDFYPPIGGYGEATVISEPGEVFFVRVTSGGQFILRPRLYNAATNTPIPDNDLNLSITRSVISGSDILRTELTYNQVDGWWEAMIDGTKQGRILFTLTYTVTLEGGTTVTLQRKIYVIKE